VRNKGYLDVCVTVVPQMHRFLSHNKLLFGPSHVKLVMGIFPIICLVILMRVRKGDFRYRKFETIY